MVGQGFGTNNHMVAAGRKSSLLRARQVIFYLRCGSFRNISLKHVEVCLIPCRNIKIRVLAPHNNLDNMPLGAGFADLGVPRFGFRVGV